MNDIYLLNERYIDSKYQIRKILGDEDWYSMTSEQRQFLRECEDLGRQEALLLEGPFDNLKAMGAGLLTKAANVGKAVAGKGDEVKDPTQAKIESRLQSFKNDFAKSLADVENDFQKLGFTDPNDPAVKALEYAKTSADKLDIKYQPTAVDKVAKNLMPQNIIKNIENKFKDVPVIKDAAAKIDKAADDLVAKFPKVKGALDKLGKLYKDHPKLTMIVFGIITVAAGMATGPGVLGATGVAVLLNTAAKYGAEGKFSAALYSSVKTAVIGKLVGGLINKIGDAAIENVLGDANKQLDAVVTSSAKDYVQQNVEAMRNAGWSPAQIQSMGKMVDHDLTWMRNGVAGHVRGYFSPAELLKADKLNAAGDFTGYLKYLNSIANNENLQNAREFTKTFLDQATKADLPLTDAGWKAWETILFNSDKMATAIGNFSGKAAAVAQGILSNVRSTTKKKIEGNEKSIKDLADAEGVDTENPEGDKEEQN